MTGVAASRGYGVGARPVFLTNLVCFTLCLKCGISLYFRLKTSCSGHLLDVWRCGLPYVSEDLFNFSSTFCYVLLELGLPYAIALVLLIASRFTKAIPGFEPVIVVPGLLLGSILAWQNRFPRIPWPAASLVFSVCKHLVLLQAPAVFHEYSSACEWWVVHFSLLRHHTVVNLGSCYLAASCVADACVRVVSLGVRARFDVSFQQSTSHAVFSDFDPTNSKKVDASYSKLADVHRPHDHAIAAKSINADLPHHHNLAAAQTAEDAATLKRTHFRKVSSELLSRLQSQQAGQRRTAMGAPPTGEFSVQWLSDQLAQFAAIQPDGTDVDLRVPPYFLQTLKRVVDKVSVAPQNPPSALYRGSTTTRVASVKVHNYPGGFERYVQQLTRETVPVILQALAQRSPTASGVQTAFIRGCVQLFTVYNDLSEVPDRVDPKLARSIYDSLPSVESLGNIHLWLSDQHFHSPAAATPAHPRQLSCIPADGSATGGVSLVWPPAAVATELRQRFVVRLPHSCDREVQVLVVQNSRVICNEILMTDDLGLCRIEVGFPSHTPSNCHMVFIEPNGPSRGSILDVLPLLNLPADAYHQFTSFCGRQVAAAAGSCDLDCVDDLDMQDMQVLHAVESCWNAMALGVSQDVLFWSSYMQGMNLSSRVPGTTSVDALEQLLTFCMAHGLTALVAQIIQPSEVSPTTCLAPVKCSPTVIPVSAPHSVSFVHIAQLARAWLPAAAGWLFTLSVARDSQGLARRMQKVAWVLLG